MRVAMEYERSQRRTPDDVSRRGVGYDVRSEGPDDEVRYIEVKGHATTGDVHRLVDDQRVRMTPETRPGSTASRCSLRTDGA